MRLRYYLRSFFLLAALLFGIAGFAQVGPKIPSANSKANKLYDKAVKSLAERKLNEAIDQLKQSVSVDPDFAYAHRRLAKLLQMNEPGGTTYVYHLQRFIELQPNAVEVGEDGMVLGQFYMNQGKYQDAAPFFSAVLKDSLRRPEYKETSKAALANIAFAQEAINNPVAIKPIPLPITVNIQKYNYFPVVTADDSLLYFTSRKAQGANGDEDIYVAARVGDAWTEAQKLPFPINTRFNDGTCSISADGRTMVFSMCEGRNTKGSCDIFLSRKVGEQWSEPENLEDINSPNWDAQPSLSADGRTLYFASDRPGTMGKADIWFSTLSANGKWSNPENLGPGINTKQDEGAPFIHVNGSTLFFASKGRIGMGNFDLYVTHMEGGSWTIPKNLGYPMNTYGDEPSICMTANGERIYYSSEVRVAGRPLSSDLYVSKVPKDWIQAPLSRFVKGRVTDATTGKPLDARLELSQLADGKLLFQTLSDAVTGKYLFTLNRGGEFGLFVTKEGYLFKSATFNLQFANGEAKPYFFDIQLEPIKVGTTARLNNLFFGYNSVELLPNSKQELDKVSRFLKENAKVTITITGHTDDVGNDQINLKLSLSRAQSVMKKLVESGIPANRLKADGKGKTQPTVPNTSEENRAQNRRIEFTITAISQ